MSSGRFEIDSVPGGSEVFTPEFLDYLGGLLDEFTPRVHAAREARLAAVERAVRHGDGPKHLPTSRINTEPWQVPSVPDELHTPGIEISGPAHVTSMFINALNPSPDGARADGDLDDDEDSAGHTLADTVQAALNRKAAVERTLTFENTVRNRQYKIADGPLPFFMHRERGLHLDEPAIRFDGKPVSAAILGTALTLYYGGCAQAERSQGIYFYLPKLESVPEAEIYRDIFAASQNRLPFLKNATIRAIILVESLPAVYQMEEMLHALAPYGAGLNAARWDLKASILEYIMGDPNSVWPDRFGVDIKTTEFLSNIFRRLVAICLKHDAVAIGGMATALPHRDDAVNQAAAAAIRADKEWEAAQGFLRGWVAHIYHMSTAASPFKELRGSGWTPSAEMANPDNYPVRLETPTGPLTQEGTRRNVRTIIEYVEGWLGGRGAKGIDSLAGKPGIHPALMEDLATARISVAQTAQRVIHKAVCEDTERVHDLPLIKSLVQSEREDIVTQLGEDADASTVARYQDASRIALRWIKNYTEFNFRSLGSYSRPQLAEIAAGPDAF